MEAILILFSGLVGVLAGLVPAVITIVFGLLSMVWELVAWAVSRGSGRVESLDPESIHSDTPSFSPPPGKRCRRSIPRWCRWIPAGLAGLGGLLFIFVCLLETVWFEPALRFIANRQYARTGIHLAFEEVEGSFLSREFIFAGLTAERESVDNAAGFKLRIEQVSGRFSGLPWTVPDRMPFLVVKGLTGDVRLPEQKPATAEGEGSTFILRDQRGFTIDRLTVVGCAVDLRFSDSSEAMPVRVTEWVSAPMGSRTWVFDLLFRTNLDATIGDAVVEIRSETNGDGRRTLWLAENLNVGLLADVFGTPWDLFSSGRVDMRVEDEWELEEADVSEVEKEDVYIHMDWLATVSDGELREPSLWPGAGLTRRAVNRAFAEYANRMMEDDQLELGFSFTFDRGEIDASLSDSLNRLWQAGFNAWLATRTDLEPEKVEALKERALKTGSWLKRRWEERKATEEGTSDSRE